jgi:hypothetical protein
MFNKEELDKILAETKIEFPDFEIIEKKDSTLMKVIDVCLKIITLGQMNMFMTGFITTLGQKVYVTNSWKQGSLIGQASILRHERVHMRQAKKYGRFLFSFLYLMVPLPIGFAYFRKKFEQEAYEESMRALYEHIGEGAFLHHNREAIITQFISANYFWMWPWRKDLEKWYDAAAEKIKSR